MMHDILLEKLKNKSFVKIDSNDEKDNLLNIMIKDMEYYSEM